jgi:hypothetical protein
MAQALVLKDVPEDTVENVVKKYKAMGAKIEIEKQADGKYTVRLTIATPA